MQNTPKKGKIQNRYHAHLQEWKRHLQEGLKEDAWQWDWSAIGSQSLPSGKTPAQKIRGVTLARSAGVWACDGLIEAVNQVARELGANFDVAQAALPFGELFQPGDTLIHWEGPPPLLLALERPTLNLAAFTCGIATQTRELVQLVQKACPKNSPRVTSTRKTLPGYRDLSVLAVIAGGGYPHRVNLAGGILLKENHIASAGGIEAAIQGARAVAPHGLKVEIEVRNQNEFKQAMKHQPEVIMLDNFSPKEVHAALQTLRSAPDPRGLPLIEVSGGLHTGNIQSYAIEGVHLLSVGSLTHSVRAADFSTLLGSAHPAKKKSSS